MTKTRNIADLLDANGDVVSGALDNVPASNNASTLTTGTLPSARLGTVTAFTSTGIDDNSNATAITIDTDENITFGGSSIFRSVNDSSFALAGGTASNVGGNITLYGGASGLANAIKFRTGSSERMRIEGTTGNVGIGLTGATYRLQLTSVYETADSPKVFKAFNNSAGSTSSPQYTYWDMAGHGGADRTRLISYDYSQNSGTRSKFVIQTSVDGGALTDRFRIENDGDITIPNNVGIGTTSPAGKFHVNGNAMIDATSSFYGNKLVVGAPSPNQTSSGGYGWGMSSSGAMMWNFHDGNAGYWNNTNSSNTSYINFRTKGNHIGSILLQSSSTAFNTSSDYRLKENVVDMTDATTRLKSLSPKRFNFIAEPNKTVDGFIAHEVSSIVPEAICGEKDAINEDGSIIAQGIDQSKLVPLLVKTIQELEARITTLETNNP